MLFIEKTMPMKTATGFLAFVLCAATASALDLVSDPEFHEGFCVKDRAGKEQVLRWNDDKSQMPTWHTAQHYIKSCFADTAFCKFRKNGLTFRDDHECLH